MLVRIIKDKRFFIVPFAFLSLFILVAPVAQKYFSFSPEMLLAQVPPASSWPNASTTGVPAGVTLTNCSTNLTAGATYDSCLFNGSITVSGKPNITITRSKIVGIINGDYSDSNLIMRDVEIDGNGSSLDATNGVNGWSCTRCNIHNASKGASGTGFTLVDSYIHDLAGLVGGGACAHMETILGSKTDGIVVTGNNLVASFKNNQQNNGCFSSVVSFYSHGTFWGPIRDVTFTGNRLAFEGVAHGGYCLYAGDGGNTPTPTNMIFRDNVFVRGATNNCADYGPVTQMNPVGGGNVWQNNRFDDGTLIGTDTGTPPTQTCNNNSIEGTEVCDGTALNSQSCTTQGFSGGTLSCNSTCTGFVTSACTSSPGGSTATLGTNTIGTITDSGDSNSMNTARFTTGSLGGTAQSISVYIVSPLGTTPNNQYSMALYSNNGSLPGTLIAQTTTGTLIANAWNTLPITATLAPNTTYWLAYNSNGTAGNQNTFRYSTGSTGQFAYKAQTFGTWPITFGTPGGTSATNPSLYLTYTTSGTPPADTTLPTVTASAPASGTVGVALTLSATASDNVGVAGVQFRVNGVTQGAEDTTSPYSISWTPSTAGTYTITAIARDTAGNTTTSNSVTVTVSTTPPTQTCGNNIREGTEVCDGTALNAQSCTTQGFTGGTLSCNGSCTGYNTTSCTTTSSTVTAFTLAATVEGSTLSNRTFTLTIHNTGNATALTTKSLTTTGSSLSVTALSLAPGSYDLYLSTPSYLKKKLTTSLANNVTITMPRLVAGNLNNTDDIINSLDWSVMSNQWGTNNTQSDINRDGIVNSVDFSFLNKNWMQAGDVPTSGGGLAQCNDGIDNDGDGKVDFASSITSLTGDKGCWDPSDNDERAGVSAGTVLSTSGICNTNTLNGNTTYDGCLFPSGALLINGPNVVVRNSKVRGVLNSNSNYSVSSLWEDVEFEGPPGGTLNMMNQAGAGATFRRVECHRYPQCFYSRGGLFEDSVAYDLASTGSDCHMEPLLAYNTDTYTMRRSRMSANYDASHACTGGGFSGVLQLYGDSSFWGPVQNKLFEYNRLESNVSGISYCLYGGGSSPLSNNLDIQNNVWAGVCALPENWSTGWARGRAGSSWFGNVAGDSLATGTPIPEP